MVRRDTYENIKATGVYTINHVHAGIRDQAHQASARFPDRLPKEILGEDGDLDLAAAGSLAVTGLEGYHQVSPPVRMPYAQPPRGKS